MSACKSCGARIIWARTMEGKAIQLDPKPRADGNIVLFDGTAHYVSSDALRAMSPRHVSHFATCPHADAHRRGKRS